MSSIKQLNHAYQLREARGQLKPGVANVLTIATVMESMIVAFHKGFYSDKEWNNTKDKVRESRVLTQRQAQHQGEQIVGSLQEALLSDVRPLKRVLEAHTTTDFPHILSQLRDRVVRRDLNPVDECPLMAFATKRTATNFQPMRSIRFDHFDRLFKRPEGTEVKYATFGTTEDLYSIANYELAFGYTWEMWMNDDLSTVQIAMEELGRSARRTRGLVFLEAIYAALKDNKQTLGTAGGPDIARLKLLKTLFSSAKFETGPSKGKNLGMKLTHVAFPVKWDDTITVALNTEKIRDAQQNEIANSAYKSATPVEDRMMGEIFDEDWLGFDSAKQWIEFASLRGYEGGPQTRHKMPDVIETIDEGCFDKHEMAIKVTDNIGSQVTNKEAAKLIKGK